MFQFSLSVEHLNFFIYTTKKKYFNNCKINWNENVHVSWRLYIDENTFIEIGIFCFVPNWNDNFCRNKCIHLEVLTHASIIKSPFRFLNNFKHKSNFPFKTFFKFFFSLLSTSPSYTHCLTSTSFSLFSYNLTQKGTNEALLALEVKRINSICESFFSISSVSNVVGLKGGWNKTAKKSSTPIFFFAFLPLDSLN